VNAAAPAFRELKEKKQRDLFAKFPVHRLAWNRRTPGRRKVRDSWPPPLQTLWTVHYGHGPGSCHSCGVSHRGWNEGPLSARSRAVLEDDGPGGRSADLMVHLDPLGADVRPLPSWSGLPQRTTTKKKKKKNKKNKKKTQKKTNRNKPRKTKKDKKKKKKNKNKKKNNMQQPTN